MALTIKRAGAAEYGRWVKMLLAGEPGSGKTRLSSTAPNVLYANVEGGLMSVADRHPAFIDIVRSEDLVALRLALAQAPELRKKVLGGVDVDTVCIDTIDNFQRMLVAERLEDQNKDAMAIADWGWLGDQLRGFVRSFRNLDMHVIFTCHTKLVEDSESGRTYLKPALQGAMQDEIAAYVDLAVVLKAQPITRVVDGEARKMLSRSMQTFPDQNHPWLKDRSGKLPMEFAVNLDNDFGRIIGAVFADIPEAVADAGVLDTNGSTPPVAVAPAPAKAAGTVKKATRKAAEKVPEKVSQAAAHPQEGGAALAVATVEAPVVEAPVEPEPVPEPEPQLEEAPAPAAQTVPQELTTEPEADEPTVSSTETVEDERIRCDNPDCPSGGFVENEDQADLSRIRFRKVLCRACFTAEKKK